jgi:outer membrane biosynthesis protein TonB
MEYNKIIAVTGLPGLYELINSKTDGAIVRSLEDKSTRFVSSRVHNFSHLESIEVYTTKENVNLVEILKAMEESAEKLPDEKDENGIKKYFAKVYKDLDFDRVYSSDLKKMVKWFIVLKKNSIPFVLTQAVAPEPAPEPAVQPTAKPAPPAKAISKSEPAVKTETTVKSAAKQKAAEIKPPAKETKQKAKEPAKTKKPAAKKAAEKKPAAKSKGK